MLKYIIILLCSIASVANAQTGTSKTQGSLNSEINTLWPDNTSGQITPFNARQTLLDMVATQFSGPLACGGVDDTSIVQSQMDTAGIVVLPPSTCVVSNLVATRDVRFVGSGPSSVVQLKSGSTGYTIDSGAHLLQIDHVKILGNNVQDYQGVTSPGSESGIHIWANVDNSMVTNSVITGFNNIALGINGDANAVNNGTVVSGNSISENYCAIDTGPSGASHTVCNATSNTAGADGGEYLKIASNAMIKNRWALVVDSGNVNSVNNDIAHNGTCLYVNGSPTPNPDHGNFVGNLCNHSGIISGNAVYINSGVGNGYLISDNNFFGGNWVLNGPDGITISGNTIAVTSGMTISGTGYINFANNWFTEINPTITDTSSNTHWNNNYGQICQCFINSQTALLVDPRGTSVATTLNTFGSNLVSDGTFTSDPGPWTKGTGWTINTGTNSAHGDGTGNSSFLFQNIGASANQYYQVTFTIANYSAGTIDVGIGGAAANWPFFANGTYTIPAVFTQSNAIDGNLYFVANGFAGDIRNVQAKLVTFTSTISVAQTLTVPTVVANLPTCNAGNQGARAFVTDQNTAVSYRGAVTGSGSTKQAVVCDGTNWLQD